MPSRINELLNILDLISEMSTQRLPNEPAQPECPICLEPNADLCLPCGNYHWLHRTCWNEIINKTICPTCRQPVIPATVETSVPPLLPLERAIAFVAPVRPSRPAASDYSRLADMILTVDAWSRQNSGINVLVDLRWDHVLRLIFSGLEVPDYLVNNIMTTYNQSRASEASEARERAAARALSPEPDLSLLSLEDTTNIVRTGSPSTRVCIRCNIARPMSAYAPRKRICNSCR